MSDFDEHFDRLTEQQQWHAIDQQLPYIATKAARYLQVGAEEYRKTDAFGQPETEDEDLLAAIAVGCAQLIECKGLFKENPLTTIGVGGFYALMSMFHFRSASRKTSHGHHHEGRKGALDAITFEHVVSGMTATLFNFCPARP